VPFLSHQRIIAGQPAWNEPEASATLPRKRRASAPMYMLPEAHVHLG
jgi:hypothetical protein